MAETKAGSMLIPSVRYKDAHAAIAWLERALGFERQAVYDGPEGTVAHAQLTFGGTGMLMLGSASNASPHEKFYATPEEIGGRVTSPLYLVVKDCAPAWERAKAAGAEVVMELKEMDYGGKSFTVRDPEGYMWSVGEYDPWK
ncbi:MAG: VOC family protein [Acidobacteriaceae bacterium]